MLFDPLRALAETNEAGYADVAPSAAAPHVGQVRVVDVREVDEFDGPLGHIAGAELAPLSALAVLAVAWDPNAPLLLVCRSGGRSGRAAVALAQAGFSHVYNLVGGMLAWNGAGLPVARH